MMSRQTRIRTLIVVMIIFAAAVFLIDFTRTDTPVFIPASAVTALPGTIALYQDGAIVTFFTPDSLSGLDTYSFEDAEEGKQQQGVLLRDAILLYVDADTLTDDTQIIVSSVGRGKSVTLTWAQVANPENHVLFDPANGRGTLKLVSSGIDTLDTRAEWIQDTDRIEIQTR